MTVAVSLKWALADVCDSVRQVVAVVGVLGTKNERGRRQMGGHVRRGALSEVDLSVKTIGVTGQGGWVESRDRVWRQAAIL